MKSTEKPTLLILGSLSDPHVHRVVSALEARQCVDVRILDCFAGTRCSFQIDSQGQTELMIDGIKLPIHFGIWDRMKFIPGTVLSLSGDTRSTEFSKYEWLALARLLSGFCLGEVFNSLDARKCLIKPYQQILASGVGLLIPETLVSNDRDALAKFHADCNEQVIVKSISELRVSPDEDEDLTEPYTLMTMRVSAGDMSKIIDGEVRFCPHQFQREIQKKHELRVVYINGSIHAFRVESQTSKITEVDWRNGHEWVHFTKCELDEDAAHKVNLFMTRIGLFSGSIDLIVDKNDSIWFLECNQDGQWAWLDDLVDGQIAEAFALAFESRLISSHTNA